MSKTAPQSDPTSDIDVQTIRDQIIDMVLPDVVFDGWTMAALSQACEKAGHDKSMVKAVFPSGLEDALSHYADLVDRRMMARLEGIDIEYLRVRDRIKQAVMARIDVLADHKEAEKKALAYWNVPFRQKRALKILWRSADLIWDWAGDTATDYNRYTKRGLLSGVMASTILMWLNQNIDGPAARINTESFLDRRIDNIMQIGKVMGMAKNSPLSMKKAGFFVKSFLNGKMKPNTK
jgi:ubiquinone biosynthesis protein COQ9